MYILRIAPHGKFFGSAAAVRCYLICLSLKPCDISLYDSKTRPCYYSYMGLYMKYIPHMFTVTVFTCA